MCTDFPTAGSLQIDEPGTSVRCSRSHSFDIARHGYVSLLDGRSGALRSDTAPMVAARRRVQDSGLYRPITECLAEVVVAAAPETIVDAGAGTGHHLRHCLERLPQARAVGLDLSKYCARALARAHERIGAVVGDVWRSWPVQSECADVVLSVFSPRNVEESLRVLDSHGQLLLVTPGPRHLAELVEPMGMLSVDPDKDDRVHRTVDAAFTRRAQHRVDERIRVGAEQIADLVGMGPSAFHRDAEEIRADARRMAGEGDDVEVTLSVTVAAYTPRGS